MKKNILLFMVLSSLALCPARGQNFKYLRLLHSDSALATAPMNGGIYYGRQGFRFREQGVWKKLGVQAPVNPDWNATSGPGQILNKPTILPQVNADWNATSGPAKILNKPTIPSLHDLERDMKELQKQIDDLKRQVHDLTISKKEWERERGEERERWYQRELACEAERDQCRESLRACDWERAQCRERLNEWERQREKWERRTRYPFWF